MAMIDFTGGDGRAWRVWDVRPRGDAVEAGGAGADPREGWLAFECAEERRRLQPIPEGWEALTANEIWRLCQSAPAVRRAQLPTRRERS